MPCGVWVLPGLGIEPMSYALAGRFLTTGPPGKSQEGTSCCQRRLCSWMSGFKKAYKERTPCAEPVEGMALTDLLGSYDSSRLSVSTGEGPRAAGHLQRWAPHPRAFQDGPLCGRTDCAQLLGFSLPVAGFCPPSLHGTGPHGSDLRAGVMRPSSIPGPRSESDPESVLRKPLRR